MTDKDEELQIRGLQEQLKELGLSFSEDELIFLMYLARKSGQFTGHKREIIGKDFIDFRLDISMEPTYAVTGYKATLQRVPPIVHGIYGGVNTQALEETMHSISWHIPAQNHVLLPQVFNEMMTLIKTGKKEAIDIMNGLQVKYWSGTAVEDFVDLTKMKRHFQSSHYFKVNGDVGDTSAKGAYNLLCGRPVLKFEQFQPRQFQPYWSSLEPTGKNTYEEKHYPFFGVQPLLEGKPVAELDHDGLGMQLFRSLIEGDLTRATFTGGSKEVPVLLSVDPEKQDIIIYDLKEQKVSFDQLVAKSEGPAIKQELPKKTEPINTPKPGRKKGPRL